jgi:hypothetical protein
MRASFTAYRIAIAAALLVSLGIFVITLHQANLWRQDGQTEAAVNEIAGKLSIYSGGTRQLPATLSAAGIKNVPKNVTYKRLNVNTYRLCASYASASPYGLYHKGLNCPASQVTLQSFSKNSDGSYMVCGVYAGKFTIDGTVMPTAVKRPDGSPVIDVGNELFVFSAKSLAFDEDCNQLSVSDLRAGDKVDVFNIFDHVQYPTTPKPAVSIFLKRS